MDRVGWLIECYQNTELWNTWLGFGNGVQLMTNLIAIVYRGN